MPSKPSSSPVRKLLTRLLPKLQPVVALALSSAAAGCVLYGEPDRSCADVVCGNNASCGGDAECFCDAGHGGNPYEGCVSTHPAVDPDCKLDCGANAYCAKDTCFCDVDHVAVCGVNAGCMAESQLCDGTADCPDQADENVAVCQPPVFQDWIITDACDDGVDVTWRIFSLDRDWAWPGVDTTFRTSGLLVDTYEVYQSLKTVQLAGFTVSAAIESKVRRAGLDAMATVEVAVVNSDGRRFAFADTSRSVTASAARAVIAVVEYFVNAERAFVTLSHARKDAVARGRADLVAALHRRARRGGALDQLRRDHRHAAQRAGLAARRRAGARRAARQPGHAGVDGAGEAGEPRRRWPTDRRRACGWRACSRHWRWPDAAATIRPTARSRRGPGR